MNHIDVKSSMIKSVGYDPETQLLEIAFHNGSIYHYPNVSQGEHYKLLFAKSVGNHLKTHHKKGKKIK